MKMMRWALLALMGILLVGCSSVIMIPTVTDGAAVVVTSGDVRMVHRAGQPMADVHLAELTEDGAIITTPMRRMGPSYDWQVTRAFGPGAHRYAFVEVPWPHGAPFEPAPPPVVGSTYTLTVEGYRGRQVGQ